MLEFVVDYELFNFNELRLQRSISGSGELEFAVTRVEAVLKYV